MKFYSRSGNNWVVGRAAEAVNQLHEFAPEAMAPEVRRARLKRNLWLIPAVRALRMCLFGITVNVTYFQSLGVTMWGVLMLKSVHSMGTLFME
eukprot:1228936-Pyramimonas_sp.AAC.1